MRNEITMNTVLLTSGRVLLALYFLLPGIMKFVSWDMHIYPSYLKMIVSELP